MCTIAILEDYSLFCSGIKPVFEKNGEFDVISENKHISELLPKLRQLNPELIIIDVIHCEYNGLLQIHLLMKM